MKNLPLILGVLSTIILSLYCVDFCREPILEKLNQKLAQKNNSSETIKQQVYTETMAKAIVVSKIVSQEETKAPREIQAPIKEQEIEKPKVISKKEKLIKVKKESELDILAKKILEDMKKNKDNKWRQ